MSNLRICIQSKKFHSYPWVIWVKTKQAQHKRAKSALECITKQPQKKRYKEKEKSFFSLCVQCMYVPHSQKKTTMLSGTVVYIERVALGVHSVKLM